MRPSGPAIGVVVTLLLATPVVSIASASLGPGEAVGAACRSSPAASDLCPVPSVGSDSPTVPVALSPPPRVSLRYPFLPLPFPRPDAPTPLPEMDDLDTLVPPKIGDDTDPTVPRVDATRHLGGAPSLRAPPGSSAKEVHSQRTVRDPQLPPGNAPTAVVTSIALLGSGSLVALYLYRRIRRDEVLDNDLRAAIVDRVEDEPAITLSELADELGVATNTVLYHVRMLDDHDLISVGEDGKYTRLFAGGARDRRTRKLLAMLRRTGKGDVLRLLRDDPGLRIAEIARRLDCHRSTAKHHVDALDQAGLLEETDGDGRSLRVPDGVLEVWRDYAG